MTAVASHAPSAAAWPSGTMRALQFGAPGKLELAEVPIPESASGEILVEVSHVGICGTDVHLLDGRSAYVQLGLTQYPIRFGHEWAGRVLAVGAGGDVDLIDRVVVGEPFISCGQCRTCRSGRYNLCPFRYEMGVNGSIPGAAAQYLRVPQTNVAVVPPTVRPEHALMAEPSVTVLNAYEIARVQPGEKVAVLGTGTIGLIAVQLGAFIGCRVDVIGIDEVGLKAAAGFGASPITTADGAPDDTYDVVVEATGSAAVGPHLTRIAAIGGRIMEVGIPGRPVDGIDLAAFVSKGLTLQGVLGGVHLLARALQLIAAGAIRPDELLDEVMPVSSAPTAFAQSVAPGRERPKVVLDIQSIADTAALQPRQGAEG